MKKLFIIFTPLVIVLTTNLLLAQSGWTLQTNPLGTGVDATLGKIQFVSENEGWISAGDGKLLHTTNGGNIWTIVSPVPIDTLFTWSDPALDMCFINPSTGWVLRTKGTDTNWQGAVVYKTIDGGVTWNELTIPNYDTGIYIQFVDENNGWIMVFNTNYTGGGVFRTTDGGNSWNLINLPADGFPYFKNSSTGWVMPMDNDSTRKTIDGGLSWTAPWGTNTQVTLNSIYFSDINNGWIVGRNGTVLRTTNGGSSWDYITNTGLTSDYNSKSVFFLNASNGWIGTDKDNENPKVLHTTNGGSSWTIQETPVTQLDGDDIFSIFFWDENNGWFTADCGRICNYSVLNNVNEDNNIPHKFSLYQNYPNPFNPSTNIDFTLPKSKFVELKVFNILGKEVANIVSNKLNQGNHTYQFDGRNLASGIYYYQLVTEDYMKVKKMILLK